MSMFTLKLCTLLSLIALLSCTGALRQSRLTQWHSKFVKRGVAKVVFPVDNITYETTTTMEQKMGITTITPTPTSMPTLMPTESTPSMTNTTKPINGTTPTLDQRVGILNLDPKCQEGQVVVRQRCHNAV